MLILFGLFTLLLGFLFAVALVSVVDPEDLPVPLRPFWTRVKEVYTSLERRLDEASDAARADFAAERTGDPSLLAQLLMPPLNPDGTPMPLAAVAWRQVQAEPKAPAAPVEPETDPTFFLHEVAAYCHFEPQLMGVEVRVTPRIYRRLVDYCALAFDRAFTPEAAFAHAGLKVLVTKGR